MPSIQHFDETFPEMTSKYGFKCSFNPTFSTAEARSGSQRAITVRIRVG